MNALLTLLFTTAAMGYNPNTGITTYDDPTVLDTSAGQPAPSTATSFPAPMTAPTPAPAPAPTPPVFFQRGGQQLTAPVPYNMYQSYGYGTPVPGSDYMSYGATTLDDGLANGFVDVTDHVRQQILAQTGQDVPIQQQFFNPQTGQWGSYKEAVGFPQTFFAWDRPYIVPTVQPSDNGFWSSVRQIALDIGPMLVGAYLGGGVDLGAGGAGAGAATEAGATGAFDTSASAGVFDSFGNPLYSSPGMLSGVLPSLPQLGSQFGSNLLQSGGNVKGALRNTAVGAGVGAGANLAADGINSVFAPTNAPSRFGNDVMFDAGLEDQALGDTMKRRFSFDADLNDSSLGAAMSARTPLMPPAVLDTGGRGMMPTPIVDTGGQPMMPTPLAPHSPGMLSSPIPMSAIASTPPSVEAQPSAEQQPQAQAPSPEVVSAKQLVDLSKIGSALAKLNAGRGQPEDAPQRQEGQTDAQYEQTLADYAHIDPQVLSDAGVTPGTPEYYQFVLSQLDSVISQITDGLDPDDASLSDKLRTKSREELDALERALFVRGQLGQLMGSGQYADPFTGLQEDVNTSGAQVNPSVAAYHRGLYRSAGELSHMDPLEARKYVGGMLDRSPDLFGMQGAHNARTMDEILSQQNMDPEDIRRRRGMFGQDPFANLGSMSERDLEATLASLLH